MTGRRPAPQGIFINYRRADSLPYARLLQVSLRERFPRVKVFMDLDSIEAGLDFARVISDAVSSCSIMVVLIGPRWTTLEDNAGRRRLDDPDDYVRLEIKAALNRRMRVIPVLVEGAPPPRDAELPPGLGKLARLHVLEMSCDHRYHYDVGRLMVIVGNVLGH